MKNLKPIRKVVVGAVAAGVAIALRALGVDLGPEFANEVAVAVVGAVAAYAVKDPRVVAVAHDADHYLAEAERIAAELAERGEAAESGS